MFVMIFVSTVYTCHTACANYIGEHTPTAESKQYDTAHRYPQTFFVRFQPDTEMSPSQLQATYTIKIRLLHVWMPPRHER
eukprot:2671474-Amphidinium_carterae.1